VSKPKTKIGCSCVDQVNEQLKKFNTVIVRELSFDFDTKQASMVLMVPTRKLDSDKRTKPKSVIASHCPFCGRKFR